MPRAYQVISGRVTNPGATVTALTPNTGDSFTIRNAVQGSAVFLENVWAQEATIGTLRVISNLLHDAVQAIRLRVDLTARPLLGYEVDQPLQPQDALTIGLSGGAAETDVGAALIWYEDLPGAQQALHSWEEIEPRIEHLVGVECNLTSGGTVGQYGGAQALNANFDLLRKNRYYAVLGYTVDTVVGVVGLSGVATSSFRVGGPGSTDPDITSDWFVELSKATGRPHIVVLNAADVPSYSVDLVHTAAAAAVNVTWELALLTGTTP